MLQIQHLSIDFIDHRSLDGPIVKSLVSDINLVIRPGELVAVVGGSGTGKSLLAHAIMGILPPNFQISGDIIYKKTNLIEKKLKLYRGKTIVLVPQSISFLDPLLRVGDAVRLAARRSGLSRKAAKDAQERMFRQLGLPGTTRKKYSHQISGGMARRVLLACTMVTRAELFIADEPTPGLDAKAAEACMGFLKERCLGGKSALVISHDIESCLQYADRIAVFHGGTIVETVPATYCLPHHIRVAHPYTKALLSALPSRKFEAENELGVEPGSNRRVSVLSNPKIQITG